MNTNQTTSRDEQSRRDGWQKIRVQRLFTPIPVCWEEVEEILPFVNRRDAQRFLDGEVDDFSRRVVYDELFRWHPALRAALTDAAAMPPAANVQVRSDDQFVCPAKGVEHVIMLRRERPAAQSADVGLRAAASPSCAPEDAAGDVRLANEEGWELWASPHPRPGWTTLRFVARQPPRPIALRVGNREVPQIEPLDEHGYLVVATAEVQVVLTGQAELAIEPARTPE